jgi:membrane protease YdiL (CAAX protease family)
VTSIPPPGHVPPPAQPRATPARLGGSAGWKPWTAPVTLVVWFGITMVLSAILALASAAMGNSLKHPPPGVNIAATFAQDFAMIGAALAFAHMAGRPRGADFGLLRTPLAKAIGAMVAIWIGFIGVSLAWKAAISLDDPQTLPDDLGIHGSTVNLVLVVVLVTVLAPIAEEIMFRGYIFRALRNWRGLWPAAIVTGLVFGAVHIGSSPIGYALPLAAFGCGLCLLYEWTGSLYPCIALHALNNAFALGVDEKWGWELPVVMVAAATVALALAIALGRALGRRAGAPAGGVSVPAPGL